MQKAQRTGLERALGIVTDVAPGEGPTALLLTLNVFVLLMAYYVIKPVREGLILELSSGAEYKSGMGGAIALALVFLVPAYARFAARLPRGKLVVGVTLFFASHLLLFYLGSLVPLIRANLGLVFYLWVGVFNMMLVAQFWAFANDIYDEEQGKRLFPLIGLGAAVGAAVGSQITSLLAVPLGRYNLLLASAALLGCCAILFHRVHVRESARSSETQTSPTPQESPPDGGSGAFGLVWRHRYLRLLAAFSVTFTLVNTNGEFMLSKLFKAAATAAVVSGQIAPGTEGDFLAASYGDFFFYVNVVGVVLQTFVVSRIVKHGGLGIAFFVLPVIALCGGLAFAIVPLLSVLRVSKVAENATDYSLNNTVRNILWLPTTREMKYRAKQAIDTFFVRLGDVFSTLFVLLFAGLLGMELRSFALLNVGVVVIWLVLAVLVIHENRRLQRLSDA